MTTVLHTADTHLGYRQYNSPVRREDFLAAFERVLDDAVEAKVDAVVHAGDVFHDRSPGLSDLLGTVTALRTLADAGIPFLAIVGNHEDKRDVQWLDLFETLGLATRLDERGTVVGDVTFYGLDYVGPSRREHLDYEFEKPETELTALVGHGQFAPLAPSIHGPAWDVETVIETSNVAFDAVLLGDEHESDQQEVADTWVTYSGSTERTSASERDDRGYNLITFDEEVHIRRRGIETRDFAFVDVELREGEGIDRVRERVREYDLADAVALVTIDGDGEPVTPAAVEEYATEQGAMVSRVNDRRELTSEDETVEVNFADPDDAVRERVRELGLSSAARGIDQTVRTTGIADSNVRDEVRRHVEEVLAEDLDAFERLSVEERATARKSEASTERSVEKDGETSPADDGLAGGEQAGEGSDGEKEGCGGNAGGEKADDDHGSDDKGDDKDGDKDSDQSQPSEESVGDPGGDGDDTAAAKTPDESAASETAEEGDGQRSMEEYL